jgi:hypothetical protein
MELLEWSALAEQLDSLVGLEQLEVEQLGQLASKERQEQLALLELLV